jgi:serine-type D-Ala-D-Ala carboxypeptidase/endopeptidase (penicillin-binding protein 4)
VLRWGPVVLVLAILAAAGAAYRWDLGTRWFGAPSSSSAAPPAVLTLPSVPTPRPVARPAPGGQPSPAAVRRALAPALRTPHLARLRAVVAPLTGRPVLEVGRGTSMPASTLKLLTATTALEALGPRHTFTTRVVAHGRHGLTLVGGGDPFLAGKQPTSGPARGDASLQALAHTTARQLRSEGVGRVRLSYDATLFTGPQVNPTWPASYVSEQVVSPISALWADEGVSPDGSHRVADPASAAAAEFAAYLDKDGVHVSGPIRATPAPRRTTEVASVSSQPLADIVERVLQNSDNEGAEVLAHQAGLALTGQGSFAGGVNAVRRTMTQLGVPLPGARIHDGSGLSRHDRVDASTLVRVLQVAASPAHPELRSVVTGLPVAAFDGSLTDRFEHSKGRGFVHAKTGTLTGTSALAGLATDARGRVLVFAFVSNHVPLLDTLDARAALDRLASALASCRC